MTGHRDGMPDPGCSTDSRESKSTTWMKLWRRGFRVGLTTRVIVLTVLAVLPALLIQAYNEYDLRRSRESEIRQRAVQITKQFGEEMGELREGASQLLVALRQLPMIQRHDGPRCDGLLASLRGSYPNYRSLAAIDLNGETICSSDPEPRRSVADLPFFKRALTQDKGLVVGNYWQDPVSGAKVIHFAMRFDGDDSHAGGMVVAALDLAWLSPHLADRGLEPGASILIADRDGNIIARLPNPAALVGKNMRRSHETIMDGNTAGWEEAVGVDGKPRIFGYLPAQLPPHDLFLSAGLSKDEAFADIDRATTRGILLIGAGLFVAMLAASFGGRRFIEAPVKDLTRAASDWRDGNYEARVRLRDPSSEMGHLAIAFNEMAEAVVLRQEAQKQAERELVELTMTLEERVRRRTNELEQANRVKSQFLANMSHEIRTPMNGVLGMLELLLATPLSGQQKRYARTALRSGESLLGIVNGVLDLSKIESGKLQLFMEPFDLQEMIEEAVDLFSGAARARNINLTCRLAHDMPRNVIGDAGRLRQILTNLLGNAVKFTEFGDVALQVGVTASTAAEATVEFRVRDSGIGISAERLDNVFDAFAQGDGSTTRRYGGTGLGLTIARQLCEMMGGSIHVTSEQGVGSVFWFSIPLKLGAGDASPHVAKGPNPLNGIPVLVIDDHQANLEIIGAQLDRMGLKPSLASDAAMALDALREGDRQGLPFKFILIDNVMPGMDGSDLARRIRSETAADDAHIIMLSSSDDIPDQDASGVERWLIKPIRQSELFDCMMSLHAGAPSEEISPSSREQCPEEKPAGGRVLLVEDNEVNQEVAKSMLRREGWTVTTAENGRIALDIFDIETFDLILMDCQMPEMDGFQATAAIRAREAGSSHRTPVIALTANAIEGDREACLRAGMDDYLPKPISRDVMRVVLRRWYEGVANEPTAAASPLTRDTTDEVLCETTLATLRELEDKENQDFVRTLLTRFLNDSTVLLEKLRSGNTERDLPSLRTASHSLKSTSAIVGAVALSKACMALEAAARVKGAAEVAPLVDEVMRKYRAIRPAVEAAARAVPACLAQAD
jgi:two-component system, sensor histidine kinase and response regulator